jgi:hypothetical protein
MFSLTENDKNFGNASSKQIRGRNQLYGLKGARDCRAPGPGPGGRFGNRSCVTNSVLSADSSRSVSSTTTSDHTSIDKKNAVIFLPFV